MRLVSNPDREGVLTIGPSGPTAACNDADRRAARPSLYIDGGRMYNKREERMLRLIAVTGFAFVVVTSAQAMTPASLAHQDDMITQVRMGCGAGRVMVNGVCQSRAGMRQERRANRRCARYQGGICVTH